MVVDENEYYRVIVPDYLLDSDTLEGSYSELSGEQPEDQSEEVEENGLDSNDYTSQFDDISTLLTSIDSTSSDILNNVDNLNNNLITFHNDCKILIGFGFCIVVYLMVKVVSTILNKILGFGNC